MKSKSIFLMAVSLGFGLVAAIGITQVMGRSKTEAVADVPKQTVLVAVDDLDINTELTAEMFTEEQWPTTMVPEGIATKFEDIEGKVITSRAGKRGPIYLSNLLNKSEMNLKNIPAGYKLVCMSLGPDEHFGGLLQPGDVVDLIAVFKKTNNTAPSSQTFLRKIRVFSIGSSTNKDPEAKNAPKGSTVVGLLLTEKQSEQVVLIQKIAVLKLALRSNADTDEEAIASSGPTTWGDDDSEAENASGMLAQVLQQAQAAMSTMQAAPTTEVAESKTFTTTVYTSDGPVQYHFDLTSGNALPRRTEGFSPSPETAVSSPIIPGMADDIDDRDEESDSDIPVEDLDSEPGS